VVGEEKRVVGEEKKVEEEDKADGEDVVTVREESDTKPSQMSFSFKETGKSEKTPLPSPGVLPSPTSNPFFSSVASQSKSTDTTLDNANSLDRSGMKDLITNLEKILQSQAAPTAEDQTLTGITPIEPTPTDKGKAESVDPAATDLSHNGESNRSLEEMIGEPGGQSTPVPSPERPKTCEVDSGAIKAAAEKPRVTTSRFEVKKVSEEKELTDPASPAASSVQSNGQSNTVLEAEAHANRQPDKTGRSRTISMEAGRVNGEEEHYDSSPSPVSCYDTASESGPYGFESLPGVVEENLARQGLLPDGYVRSEPFQPVHTITPLCSEVGEYGPVFNQQQPGVQGGFVHAASGVFNGIQNNHQGPSVINPVPSHQQLPQQPTAFTQAPTAFMPPNHIKNENGQEVVGGDFNQHQWLQHHIEQQNQQAASGLPQEEHQVSGDSIPVGCEASHLEARLDISQDSGMVSLTKEPSMQQQSAQVCVPQALLPSSTLNNIPGNSAFVQQNFRPQPQSTFIPVEPAKDTQLDVESVEDDHETITEEESIIQSALNKLEERHIQELDCIARRMEEVKAQYAQDKENYRIQLVSSLLAAKKNQEQERLQQQQMFNLEQTENLRKLQEQKEQVQKKIDMEIQQQRQHQMQRHQSFDGRVHQIADNRPHMFSPPANSQTQPVHQPVPRIAYINPGSNQILTMHPQSTMQHPQFINMGGHIMEVSVAGTYPGGQQVYYAPNPGEHQLVPPHSSQHSYSPASQEHEEEEKLDRLDCASVQSEPVRPLPVELAKRDSLSDSGAEGSGTNTPTRGRTYTEGLLRFVQDSSLQQKPERRVSNIDAPSSANLMSSNMAPPSAAHVPVIQPNHAQLAALSQSSFPGVIQQTHMPEAVYPTDLKTRSGSSLSGHAYTIHPNQPASMHQASRSMFVDPSYNHYMTVGANPSYLQEHSFRPQNSTSPPMRQEARPASSLQHQMLGGETHSLRQPIMSSVATPSQSYNSIPGIMPMTSHGMYMSSASQGMYLPAARYQNPLAGTPISPPGMDPRVNLGLVHHPSQLVNLPPGASGLHSDYRVVPGHSNLPMNLGQGSMILPESSRSQVHELNNLGAVLNNPNYSPQGLMNPALAGLSSGAGMINPASSVLNHTSGVLNSNQAVISSSLGGLHLNHQMGIQGASYPSLPPGLVNPSQQLNHSLHLGQQQVRQQVHGQQQQQVHGQLQQQQPQVHGQQQQQVHEQQVMQQVHGQQQPLGQQQQLGQQQVLGQQQQQVHGQQQQQVHGLQQQQVLGQQQQVLLNPTPGSSVAGSMSGSYHESVHLEDPSAHAPNLDLDPTARQQQSQ